VGFGPLKCKSESPEGSGAIRLRKTQYVEGYGLYRLRKKGEERAKSPKIIPQGLKPGLILLTLYRG
jgi:hypothetical protein